LSADFGGFLGSAGRPRRLAEDLEGAVLPCLGRIGRAGGDDSSFLKKSLVAHIVWTLFPILVLLAA